MARLALFLSAILWVSAPAFAAPKPGRALEVKVWVLNFDPIIDPVQKTRLHEECKWNDPKELAKQYAADVKEASGGLVSFKIVGWDDLDEFPVKADGFTYNAATYMLHHRTNKGWHQPDLADYPLVIAKYKLAERIEQGEFDEVWWFGAPYFGFGESAMAGRGAFYINGPVYDAPDVKCKQAFAIMGFSYERGPAEMIHNLCHRTESTMSRIFGGWQADRLDTDWARFAANAHQSKGIAAVGTCHYPPNGTADYDYANPNFVDSTADDWQNYPNLTGAKSKVNCETWGGPDYQRNYLKWWFARLPHADGVNPANGRLNNWWEFVFRFNEYDARGKIVEASDPKSERAAALAVLKAGGKLSVLTSDGKVEVTAAPKLPAGDFEVTEIHLAGRPITAEQLATLARLPRLRLLNLGSTPVTDTAFARITALPTLEWLSLSGTKITGKALININSFPELVYLELNNTAISDAAIKHLAKHPTLRELHLTSTAITDAGIIGLEAIPKLTTLSLAETKITDVGLASLAKMQELSTVWLSKTRTTEAGVNTLKSSLPNLTIHR